MRESLSHLGHRVNRKSILVHLEVVFEDGSYSTEDSDVPFQLRGLVVQVFLVEEVGRG